MTDAPDTSGELKCCPLCGGPAELWRAHSKPERSAWIACVDQCMVLTKEYETDAEAINAWNTRTPDTAAQSRIAELEGNIHEYLEILKLMRAVLADVELGTEMRFPRTIASLDRALKGKTND